LPLSVFDNIIGAIHLEVLEMQCRQFLTEILCIHGLVVVLCTRLQPGNFCSRHLNEREALLSVKNRSTLGASFPSRYRSEFKAMKPAHAAEGSKKFPRGLTSSIIISSFRASLNIWTWPSVMGQKIPNNVTTATRLPAGCIPSSSCTIGSLFAHRSVQKRKRVAKMDILNYLNLDGVPF
jgi:hypothetical protein